MPTTIESHRLLADTNILVRFVNPEDAQHRLVTLAIAELQNSGFEIYYTPQNLRKFWNVATRPLSGNGFGLGIEIAHAFAQRIEAVFAILQDSQEMHEEWRRLAVEREVKGLKYTMPDSLQPH